MPSYTYTTNIPASTDVISQSQPTLQTNCNSVNSIINVDHYTFGSLGSNDGYHKQITFAGNNVPSVPTTPPVLFTNTQDGAGNNLPNSLPQLFFYSGSASNGQDNYVSTANGSVLLMGGIIMKWGNNSGSSPVTFGVAFPNACFSVVITARSNGAQFNVTAKSTTSFSYASNPAGQTNFYWIAIGN